VLVWFEKHVDANIVKKEFTYRYSDRQLDDIFEGNNMVPHENVYIRETNLIKSLEIMKI